MERNLPKYIKQVNFDKQYKKLIKKYQNKKIVIYGAGQLFKIINEKYDLSKLNIVGICDRSFDVLSNEKEFLGYKKILIDDLANCDADLILTGTYEYIYLIDYLKKTVFKKRKISIRPLIYMTVGMFLKEFFFGIDDV